MLDEAGQDLVEIEPRADVAGDPPQRVGTVKLVRDLVGGPCRPNRRGDRFGGRDDDVTVGFGEGAAPGADDHENAPRAALAGDHRGDLGSVAAAHRRDGIQFERPSLCGIEGRAGRPERPRQLDEPDGQWPGDGPWHERRAADLPDADQVEVVGVVDGLDGRGKDLVDAAANVRPGPAGDRGELGQELEVALAPLALEPVVDAGEDDEGRLPGLRGASVDALAAGDVRVRGACGRLDGTACGRGEEPLEVAQAVAAVAPGVDPVIAQPARITPRPDRVGVDPQHPGGLGDGERRVGWARRDGGHGTRLGRKCELDAATLPSSQFLPIGRKSTTEFGQRRLVLAAWALAAGTGQ